ncbi:unnamed protein product [Brassica napus]|uniref:(rape) hypothetical protein n=1 Tax=Brassica napus TaxID=3708 RepID=A0A816I178_BRANA|nr:unnamed protein product [Brassica napus]
MCSTASHKTSPEDHAEEFETRHVTSPRTGGTASRVDRLDANDIAPLEQNEVPSLPPPTKP